MRGEGAMYADNAHPGDAFVQHQRGQYPPQYWSAATPSQHSSTPNTLRPHHARQHHAAHGIEREEEDSSPQEPLSPPSSFVPHAPSPPSQQLHPNHYHPEQNSFPAPVVIGSMFSSQAQDPYTSQPAVHFNEAQLAVDEVTNRARAKGFRDELTIAANGSVTPGVDDTPYLRYALEALTREHGHGSFSPPSSAPSPADNTGYYRAAGYLPDDLQSPLISGDPESGFSPMVPVPTHTRDSVRRQSRPQSNAGGERPSMSLGTRIISMSPPHSADSRYHHNQDQNPAGAGAAASETTPKWLPISERESVFPGMTKLDTIDEDRSKFPRLNFVPTILRLPSLIALMTLCLVIIACLMVAAIYSPIQPGLLTYGETIYSGKYFLFRILPQLFASFIFIYAQCVTTATLRILPFVALSEDEPLRRRNALFQDLYQRTFLLPQLAGPIHVKIALAILWLSAFAIPLASASFTVILVDVWYWTAVQGVVWTLLALYFLVIGAVVVLLLFWHNRVTGLMWDPRSIADLSVMISRSNTRDSYRGAEVAPTRGSLRRVLRNRIVDRLGYWMTDNEEMPWYGLGTEHSQGHTPSDLHYDIKNESSSADDRRSVTSTLLAAGGSHDDYIRTYILPWCLRTSQVLLFVTAATVLLTALFVVSFLHRTSLIDGFRPGVPAGPSAPGSFSAANFLYSFVPSFIGLLLYLAFQTLEQQIRILQPWADLNTKDGAPASRSVLADYAACLPLQSTLHALRNNHWRVAALSLLSLLLAFLPALAGGLFMALTAIRPSDSGVRMFPNVPVFGVILALLVLYLFALVSLLFGRNQYRLPHAVTCPAEIFSFLANEDNATDPAFQAAPRSGEKLRVYLGAGGPGSSRSAVATQSTWMFGYLRGRDDRRLGVRRQKRFTGEGKSSFHERAPSRRSMM
ncbi:phosphoribosylaminoimidazole-succinocarboxamide synthase [Colletotrichum orchidophilum]|uniref:Phosphoribosylaminoimidazole-succinocarboxamide synthase n=1 Tax=Colletotrichum orchidophilum TaxID=1209926 RepID=A0A1G4BP62_9PEZI|nr:phosphoribosylaminoimidazole-succinocarboxamide synthase [Colletotrichum orchidophilum]OHF03251.1 phosphoribosylaminoimidazole-succinocarboxamide synthase [Colletotrichum orchidophilum]